LKISYILCAASLCTGFASAADFGSATPAISGYGEIFAGKFLVDSQSEKQSLIGATTSANVNFDQRWNIQADITYDALNFASSKVSGIGGAAHAYWRDPKGFALGGFASFSKARWAIAGTKIDIANQWTAGLETQAYLGDITLYGQAWIGKSQTFSNPAMSQIGVRAVARYYANDNLRLDGEINYVSSHKDSIRDTNTAAAAQINYRLASMPVTLFGRFQVENHHANSVMPSSTTVKKLFVGLRFSFGSDSLKDEERNGTAMDIYRPNLPVLPLNIYSG
jgi:hypothetical protein